MSRLESGMVPAKQAMEKMMVTGSRDLESPEEIAEFVDHFYARLLRDPELAPIFVNVAAIDIREHLPRICAYWEKLLLGKNEYRRHTMNLHRALHARRPLTASDFDRWLEYFCTSVDAKFKGRNAERAKQIASRIAANMQTSMSIRLEPGVNPGHDRS